MSVANTNDCGSSTISSIGIIATIFKCIFNSRFFDISHPDGPSLANAPLQLRCEIKIKPEVKDYLGMTLPHRQLQAPLRLRRWTELLARSFDLPSPSCCKSPCAYSSFLVLEQLPVNNLPSRMPANTKYFWPTR